MFTRKTIHPNQDGLLIRSIVNIDTLPELLLLVVKGTLLHPLFMVIYVPLRLKILDVMRLVWEN